MEARIVITTYPANEKGLEEFIGGILERRLAACVSSCKVESRYWWKGKVERDEEVLLIMKTVPERVEDLRRYISENHPYDVPEILVLSAEALGPYGDWLLRETLSPNSQLFP